MVVGWGDSADGAVGSYKSDGAQPEVAEQFHGKQSSLVENLKWSCQARIAPWCETINRVRWRSRWGLKLGDVHTRGAVSQAPVE